MNAIRQDRVIAGGPEDFMEVRHLVLAGTNEEIGRALANLAIERFGLEAPASTDRLRTRVQRRYIEMNYPILHDRMRGVLGVCDPEHIGQDVYRHRSVKNPRASVKPSSGCGASGKTHRASVIALSSQDAQDQRVVPNGCDKGGCHATIES